MPLTMPQAYRRPGAFQQGKYRARPRCIVDAASMLRFQDATQAPRILANIQRAFSAASTFSWPLQLALSTAGRCWESTHDIRRYFRRRYIWLRALFTLRRYASTKKMPPREPPSSSRHDTPLYHDASAIGRVQNIKKMARFSSPFIGARRCHLYHYIYIQLKWFSRRRIALLQQPPCYMIGQPRAFTITMPMRLSRWRLMISRPCLHT